MRRAQIARMSSRPSWRPLLAGTAALFLVIFAFLAGQLHAGGDPALKRGAATAQPATDGATGAPRDDGFVPGGSVPAPAVPAPPTTHQS
jgi:hypothetical protein